MPLVRVETNQKLDAVKSQDLCQQLSRVLAEVIGKPERYVQVVLHQNTDQNLFILHGGAPGGQSAAFVDVRSIGGLERNVNRTLSARLCTLLSDFGIPGDRVYLNFTDVSGSDWGHAGSTFG